MDVIIVGAGLAGLAAAVDLQSRGHEVRILEASDGVGGRVRTDDVGDGHLADRGFQILLSAYPEARDMLDYDALDLRAFAPGSLIRWNGAFHHLGDPLRDPSSLLPTLRAPVGSPLDKARILKWRLETARGPVSALWQREDVTAATRLEELGFSDAMRERFLRPLFAGITLEPDLQGSSRVIDFVFRMLATGDAVVPAKGMGAIPEQLAAKLGDHVLLRQPVVEVGGNHVVMASGERHEADAVVVATGVDSARELAGTPERPWRGVTTVWFGADEAPHGERLLALNGHGVTPINSMAVMSNVAPAYAPAGKATIQVSAPSLDEGLADAMTETLVQWYGPDVRNWERLRVDRIAKAQPAQLTGLDRPGAVRAPSGAVVCGDHTTDASINGALAAGRAGARLVVENTGR